MLNLTVYRVHTPLVDEDFESSQQLLNWAADNFKMGSAEAIRINFAQVGFSKEISDSSQISISTSRLHPSEKGCQTVFESHSIELGDELRAVVTIS